jgi:uncharacterized protein YciI
MPPPPSPALRSKPRVFTASPGLGARRYLNEPARIAGDGGPCILLAMAKQHYFFKLIPPRKTFAQDMTAEEKRLMEEHARFMREEFDAGRILLFGPVMAAGGAFGVGVFEVDDESEARSICENDPTVRAGVNTFELHRMHLAAAQAGRA